MHLSGTVSITDPVIAVRTDPGTTDIIRREYERVSACHERVTVLALRHKWV
jgi:hypothetical protein